MLNQRLAAAQKVAQELMPMEASIEEALMRGSRLALAILEGRQSAKLPITAGQESLKALASTQAALLEARSTIAEAHALLNDEKTRIGLGARSMGDWGECPPASGSVETAPSQKPALTVVA